LNASGVVRDLLELAGEMFVENQSLKEEKMELQSEIIRLREELNKQTWDSKL